ncbi:hypothetical protein BD769DRAFT_1384769 [Suillus cothurnatus]|nr:hypothetical protein BD769DRAFT_1384769 [Suillus cothurnatus]
MLHVKPGFNALHIPCTKPGCNHWFKNKSGLTQHTNTIHSVFTTNINPEEYNGANLNEEYCAAAPSPVQPPAEFFGPGDHLYRNYHPNLTAHPCDSEGNFLLPGTPPPLLSDKTTDDWTPYADCTHLGDVQWQSCLLKYTGEHAVDDTAPWMEDSYDVWFCNPHDVVRNMLANPDYTLEMDLQPYHEHQWQDFMSGDWAWNKADQISDDPDTHGLTFVPVILGSDKTTVSVATGQNNYYPLYASIRNVHNNQCQRNLKPAMTKPEVARFGDGHYCCVIYELGPYIADYEEQVLLACIVKNWCTKCLSYCKSLDDNSLQCSKTHTEALIEECDHLALWDEFGIVTQLVVSLDVISEEHHDNIDHQEPPATVLPAGVGENDGGTDIEVVDHPITC